MRGSVARSAARRVWCPGRRRPAMIRGRRPERTAAARCRVSHAWGYSRRDDRGPPGMQAEQHCAIGIENLPKSSCVGADGGSPSSVWYQSKLACTLPTAMIVQVRAIHVLFKPVTDMVLDRTSAREHARWRRRRIAPVRGRSGRELSSWTARAVRSPAALALGCQWPGTQQIRKAYRCGISAGDGQLEAPGAARRGPCGDSIDQRSPDACPRCSGATHIWKRYARCRSDS
jgi:hypothetical protein